MANDDDPAEYRPVIEAAAGLISDKIGDLLFEQADDEVEIPQARDWRHYGSRVEIDLVDGTRLVITVAHETNL